MREADKGQLPGPPLRHNCCITAGRMKQPPSAVIYFPAEVIHPDPFRQPSLEFGNACLLVYRLCDQTGYQLRAKSAIPSRRRS